VPDSNVEQKLKWIPQIRSYQIQDTMTFKVCYVVSTCSQKELIRLRLWVHIRVCEKYRETKQIQGAFGSFARTIIAWLG
jgi:hypothetical protein